MTMKDKDRNSVESVSLRISSQDTGRRYHMRGVDSLAGWLNGIVMCVSRCLVGNAEHGSNNTAQGRIQPSNCAKRMREKRKQAEVRARQCRGVARIRRHGGEHLFTAYCFEAEWMQEERRKCNRVKITRSFIISQGLSLTGSIDRRLKTVIEPDLNTHSAPCPMHDVDRTVSCWCCCLYSINQQKGCRVVSQPVGYDSARFPMRLLLLLLLLRLPEILQRRIGRCWMADWAKQTEFSTRYLARPPSFWSSAFSPL